MQKGYLTYLEHWKPTVESVHLVAGGAFARGLEVARRAFYEQGKPPLESVGHGIVALLAAYGDFQCPDDSAKGPERMAGALEYYFDRWPLGEDTAVPHRFADGKLGIEFSFAQPLPILHPTTGNPIIYAGRCDMFADFAGGLYLEDDKTASQLGASWPKQWNHRSQFTGYAWAAREIGLPAKGIIVRGVSILKTKYDSAESITQRANWELDRWYEMTLDLIRQMLANWERGYWPHNLDHACAEYGGCTFNDICKADNPEEWLPVHFTRRKWNPLTREETPV
jgi:hypothetical protein